jgi:hypothetical protein
MALKPTQVFVPGSFPTHTYVERESERLEQILRDALDTPGQVVSLSGPSKSGKTVLVERVVGRDCLIAISGAGISSADEVWERVLDWMDVPNSATRTRSVGGSVGGEAGGAGGVDIPGVVRLEGSGKVKTEGTVSVENEVRRERRGLTQVVDEIADSEFVVLIDDFHYMPRGVQVEAAKSLKEAVRLGVKTVTAAVSHRGDDVVRANPELRGRVRGIDLNYWNDGELGQIAAAGFGALNTAVKPEAIDAFVKESAGSPQLMQLICLHACFVLGVREKFLFTKKYLLEDDDLRATLEQASSNTDFRSLVDVLEAGPKTRGTERKTYEFTDETKGDVYRCVLKAIAADPPRLSFKYDELLERTTRICHGEAPVGSSVTGTCLHMTRLAQERFPSERVIDWDEQKQILDIPDPYLLFYLRWSGRLKEE